MSRVKQIQQSFDQELAESGRRRTSRREYLIRDGVLVYVSREVIVPAEQFTQDRIPWWSRSKKTSRRK